MCLMYIDFIIRSVMVYVKDVSDICTSVFDSDGVYVYSWVYATLHCLFTLCLHSSCVPLEQRKSCFVCLRLRFLWCFPIDCFSCFLVDQSGCQIDL